MLRCGRCLAIAEATSGPDRPLRATWSAALSSLIAITPQSPSLSGGRSRDSGRQRVRQIFTYSGFLGCRAARHPSCNAHDSASFAHGPVSTTCSKALNTGRSLASHAYLTLSRDSSVSIESVSDQYPIQPYLLLSVTFAYELPIHV